MIPVRDSYLKAGLFPVSTFVGTGGELQLSDETGDTKDGMDTRIVPGNVNLPVKTTESLR